jgi:hypothetical protein
MRYVGLTWLGLTLAAGSALAQEVVSPTSAVSPQPGGPWAQKIFFGVTSHDFGTVPHGAQLKHRFKMQNIYAVPLELTNIKPSCGCLSATPSTKQLKPKEEGYIDVVMDGRKFNNFKSVTLSVTVGPQFVSTATMVLTANARSDVVFNPGQVDFGNVTQGQTPTQTIDVEYAGTLDWRVLEVVKSAEAPFAVTARELYREAPRSRLLKGTVNGKAGYQIAVTLKPNVPPGPFRQELILKTNDPQTPVLTVAVEGTVQGSLSVTPSVVSLGKVKAGTPTQHRVAIRGSRPFKILALEGAGDGITAELPQQAAAAHVLTLQCVPALPGEWHRQITIRTDLDDGNAIATVTVEASVQP